MSKRKSIENIYSVRMIMQVSIACPLARLVICPLRAEKRQRIPSHLRGTMSIFGESLESTDASDRFSKDDEKRALLFIC